MSTDSLSSPDSVRTGRGPGTFAWLATILAVVALGLGLLIAAAVTVPAYRIAEDANSTGTPEWPWALAHVGGLALVAALGGLTALLVRTPPLRAYAWAITGFATCAAALGLARAVDVQSDGWRTLIVFGIALAWDVVGFGLARRRRVKLARTPAGLLALGLAGGLLLGTPWLVFGALDSGTGVLADLAVGSAIGAGTWLWSATFIFEPTAETVTEWRRAVLIGGLVEAVCLLCLGISVGANGMQLLYGPALAGLGWLIAWMDRAGRDRRQSAAWAVVVLVALTLGIALGAIDPEEQGLFLMEDLVGAWATAASLLAGGLAVILGLAGIALGERRSPFVGRRTGVGLAAVAVSLLIAGGGYWGLGHPGQYGERLFVVLRDQADLSTLPATSDPHVRAAAVYAALTAHAERSQADIRATLDRMGVAYTPYYLVNAIEIDGGSLLHLYLSSRSDVAEVMISQRLRPAFRTPATSIGSEPGPVGPEWNLTQIGVDRVWAELGARGAGIVVGQSDSGVDGSHPALAGSYRGRESGDSYNWLDPWEGTASPTDRGGHGTHTLGTILGQGGIGVAPDAEWFACRNLARNLGSPALYLECMQFMLAPYPQGGDSFRDGDPTRGANVINNSWGCPPVEGCTSNALGPAVSALRAAGIFVVASAGNDGPGCSTARYPIANDDAAFSVAAVDRFSELADFSSRGPAPDGDLPKPDIAAPGVGVLSSLPDGTYGSNSGTSMAGPHIVGVVALMWSANPSLVGDVDTTERLLRETAQPYAGTLTAPDCDLTAHPEWAVGAGIVDAYAAVEAAIAQR